jgi:hypothetical protein
MESSEERAMDRIAVGCPWGCGKLTVKLKKAVKYSQNKVQPSRDHITG